MDSANSQITINQYTYSILDELGRGAFGIVFKCLNQQKNEIVAIKLQQNINKNELQMLNKMKGQNFKNLIKIYELHNQDDIYYIVMEYCKESLFDRIKSQGTIKPDDVRFIMKEIGNGIKEIHDLGYAHRDIKPENVLIFQKEDCNRNIQDIYKICDFGTIKNIDVLKTESIGTAYYQAPEQLNKSIQYTQKVDIWAFGALIYELMTNIPLFNGFSEDEIKYKILTITQQEIDYKINNNLQLDRKYKTLLLNMLQIDPNKRHDINKFVQDIRGQSQNVTRNPILKQPQPPQVQVQQFIPDLPKPKNYQMFRNIQQSTCNNYLPNPIQIKNKNESIQQQQQVPNFNNQIQPERSRQINDVQKISQNSYSLNSRNNQFQNKPINNVQQEIGQSQQINQFPINTSMEIKQNQNFTFSQQQSPPQQQVSSVPNYVQPIINLQQSNNMKQNSTAIQNQIQQKNVGLQNNYFVNQSQQLQQNPQSGQIQNQIRNSQNPSQIKQIQSSAFERQNSTNYSQNQGQIKFGQNIQKLA